MLNKENYAPWSSRLLRYAKSKPNGKLIHNSIINSPYVRRMIPEPGDPNRKVPVNETFHVQIDDELTKKELKQIEADDQAIQTILLGLPKDIFAAVDSCETAEEIWLRVQQMMKGSDIGIQEKKAIQNTFQKRLPIISRVDNTKSRRPQPSSNTKNDRVPSASKSSRSKNKEVEVEEYHRKLLLFKNKKHMSSECNNVKLSTQNVYSKVVCAMCKQCLISVNHEVCLLNYVNDMNSHGKKQTANVSNKEKQKKQKSKVKKPKKVGSIERLATPKPSEPRSFLRWSPTGRFFDLKGKIIASSKSESQSDCSKSNNACTSNLMEPTIKRFPNSTSFLGRLSKFIYGTSTQFLGTVRFENDHVAAILGFGDLQWGNILITRVYFNKGLGHNLFLVRQFYDSDLEEHLCPSYEQGKSKRASHPPKPVLNSRQRLHLLPMDLCGPMRIASINGKRVFNRKTKKIIKTMNVSFDEHSTMAFEQRSSKPELQSMTFATLFVTT
nr:hypothetical protein [Tanacetum cinerariifolium]